MKYKVFKKQIESLIPDVKIFSFSLTHNQDTCNDLAQQSFAVALSKAKQFKDNSNLKAWLFRIVYTTWIDINRKNATITNYKNMVQKNYLVSDTSKQNIFSLNTYIDYKKLVSLLPEKQKAPFHLVCIEGYTYKEAANILQISIGTIASRVTQSRCIFNQYFSGRSKTDFPPKKELL